MKLLTSGVALSLLSMGMSSSAKQETSQLRRSSRKLVQMTESCMLLERHTWYRTPDPDGDGKSWACEMQGADRGPLGAQIFSINATELETMAKANNHELVSGESTLYVEGAMIRNGRIDCPEDATAIFGRINRNRNLLEEGEPIMGNHTVLAIRVVTRDASTTRKTITTSDQIFGTYGDPVNLGTQYRACSHGQLDFTPTTRFKNGVFTVPVNLYVEGNSDATIRNAVTAQLTRLIGDLRSQFDHVMYCLPPGTNGNWIAYAYVNHYLSVYNDQWCNYVSAQMHEIGHNLGLGHSGEGSSAYGDQTGMMGYSYGSSNTPRMCFNGPKSWQLGWFKDHHTTVNGLTESWRGDIIGLAQYPDAEDGQSSIVRLVGNETYNYYLSFNRAVGVNDQTRERPNWIMITRVERGIRFPNSQLIATIHPATEQTRSYTIENFGGPGQNVTITAHRLEFNNVPAYADVSITGVSTPNPTPSPTNPPTAMPTALIPMNSPPSPDDFQVKCVCRAIPEE